MTPSAAGDSRCLKSSQRVQRPQPSRASISGAFAVTSPFPPSVCPPARLPADETISQHCGLLAHRHRLPVGHGTAGLEGRWWSSTAAQTAGIYCKLCKLESTRVGKRRKIKISCVNIMTYYFLMALHVAWLPILCSNITCSPALIQSPCVLVPWLQPSDQPSHVASEGSVLHELSSTRVIGR